MSLRSCVRKHPAPEGALRRECAVLTVHLEGVRKHPAPEGALRQSLVVISTPQRSVRKHPAPEGALRLIVRIGCVRVSCVRKHPAPEGALRLVLIGLEAHGDHGQKAPSTRRCIKTLPVMKLNSFLIMSESTQHQKVH